MAIDDYIPRVHVRLGCSPERSHHRMSDMIKWGETMDSYTTILSGKRALNIPSAISHKHSGGLIILEGTTGMLRMLVLKPCAPRWK